MKLPNDKKIKNKYTIAMALAIFAIFVGLSCASAADLDASDIQSNQIQPTDNHVLDMTVKYTAGTGYHWEISPDCHDVTYMFKHTIDDNPGTLGSSGTLHYYFYEQSDDYYVKLDLISPTGEIVKSVDSNMIN